MKSLFIQIFPSLRPIPAPIQAPMALAKNIAPATCQFISPANQKITRDDRLIIGPVIFLVAADCKNVRPRKRYTYVNHTPVEANIPPKKLAKMVRNHPAMNLPFDIFFPLIPILPL